MRTLWYLRHHYMVRLISLGVNTLALDGDITLQANPYSVLKALPLSRHTLLYSLDHRNVCDEVNIGFMYCNNCSDGGRWATRRGADGGRALQRSPCRYCQAACGCSLTGRGRSPLALLECGEGGHETPRLHSTLRPSKLLPDFPPFPLPQSRILPALNPPFTSPLLTPCVLAVPQGPMDRA